MKNSWWTQQEDDLLRECYKKRTTIEISELLDGRSPASIRKRAVVLGLSKSPTLMADHHEEIVEMLNRGLSYGQIAMKLDAPRSTIGNYVHRHQLKRGVSNLMRDFLYGHR